FTVKGISVLYRFRTAEKRDRILSLAAHRTKREIESLVAELHPRLDVPSVIRKLPERSAVSTTAERPVELIPGAAHDSPPAPVSDSAPPPAPAAPLPVVEPLSPCRYKIQFTAGAELHDDLERLRALLRSEVPDGDRGAIVGKALRELRQRLEARRFALTHAPRKSVATTKTDSSSRLVPAAIRRAVYKRDRGQCCFVDGQGRRCPERH